MSDPPDNIVLALLRRIDARIDRMDSKLGEVVVRLGAVERDVA